MRYNFKQCEFPDCEVEFDARDYDTKRKYCKPHSELLRRAKMSGEKYREKQINKKVKELTKLRKVFIRKCFTCDNYLPINCNRATKFCGVCIKKRNSAKVTRANHKRALARTFDRMQKSMCNSYMIMIRA